MITKFSVGQDVISTHKGVEHPAKIIYIRTYEGRMQYRIVHYRQYRDYKWVPVGEEEGNIREMTLEDKLKYLKIGEKSPYKREEPEEKEEDGPKKKMVRFENHPVAKVEESPVEASSAPVTTAPKKLEYSAGEPVISLFEGKEYIAFIFCVAQIDEKYLYWLRHYENRADGRPQIRMITVGVDDHLKVKKMPGLEWKRIFHKYEVGEKVLTKFDGVKHIGYISAANSYTGNYSIRRDLWGEEVKNFIPVGNIDDVIEKWPVEWP
ncbi:unnamed protein product [Caenorhabditis brenneri]